jgi:hypothetical protein
MIMECAFVSALESCGGFGIKISNAWWLLLYLVVYGFDHLDNSKVLYFFPVGSAMGMLPLQEIRTSTACRETKDGLWA